MRSALSKIVGTSDLPADKQFSIASLDKAASEFKKMQISRGEWAPEIEIYKYVKNAGWAAGNFIRTEFRFSNYFKQEELIITIKATSFFYQKN